MTYEEARKVIAAMKEKFNDSGLVGREKDKSFKSSIGAIYQSVGGKDVTQRLKWRLLIWSIL